MRPTEGIRLRLALRAALLSFAAMAGVAAVAEFAAVRPLVAREDPRILARAEALAEAVRKDGPAGFRRSAAASLLPGGGDWAALEGPDGALLAHEGAPRVPGPLPEGAPAVVEGVAPGGDRAVALEARGPDGTRLRVAAGTSLRAVRRLQTDLRLVLGLPMLAAVALVGIGAWVGAGAVLRPLGALTRSAREAASDPARRRLEVPAEGGEFRELGRLLDDLLVRLQALLDEERRFASDAAHELQNPLAVLKLRAERALASGDPGEVREALEAASAEEDRLSRLVQALLEISRAPEPGGVPGGVAPGGACDAAAVLAATLPDLEVLGSTRGVRVALEAPRDGTLPVAVSQGVLETCVSVLVDNALRYSPAGSEVRVAGRREGDRVLLEVRDEGPGVPEDERERVFDRLYRGSVGRRSADPGFGLGLSLARRLARSGGGDVVLLNPGEKGARFQVSLPAGPPLPAG